MLCSVLLKTFVKRIDDENRERSLLRRGGERLFEEQFDLEVDALCSCIRLFDQSFQQGRSVRDVAEG